MAKVVAIRHGEVENPDNVIYARLPGFRLSERGRAEATSLAERLAGSAVREVWASPLERAQETAEILAGPHGLTVQSDERLLEWSFWTRWQGTPWATVRERAPQVFSAYADDPGALCPEDPLADVGGRVLEWAREAGTGDGLVLAVSHEAPLVAAYLVGAGSPIAAFSGTRVAHLDGVRLNPSPVKILDLGVNGEGIDAE